MRPKHERNSSTSNSGVAAQYAEMPGGNSVCPHAVILPVTGISKLKELLMELTATGWNFNKASILQRSK